MPIPLMDSISLVIRGIEYDSASYPNVVGAGVYCSTGKQVLGGGCNLQSGSLQQSIPNVGHNGWACYATSATTITAFAICATTT